jgi:NAD(P)-dependent dehydrogenase (short-subunit alcohol dehydrogenase family)
MTATLLLPKDLFFGQVAIITGGGSGINLGIAKVLAEHGASVAICGRTQIRLDSAKAELEQIGGAVFASVADVRDPDALKTFVDAAEAALGTASILVCGAAGNFLVPAEELSPNGFKTVIDIDLLGSFNAARAAFDQLSRTRGKIIFISAGQSYVPQSFQAHAGAAKAGVDQLMRNLALEWGRHGIRVNSVVPGPIDGTEGLARLSAPAQMEMYLKTVPLGRLGRVDEIGQAVAFLCSPLAEYITGTQLIVDGGANLAGSALANMAIGTMLAQSKAS